MYRPKEDVTINGKKIPANEAFVVPKKQTQTKLLEAMFEDRTAFKDSLFYDVSAFSFRHSFGVEMQDDFSTKQLGEEVKDFAMLNQPSFEYSEYAYVVRWSDFNAPKLVYQLLNSGLRPRVATKEFSDGTNQFTFGDILVPVKNQMLDAAKIHELLTELAQKNKVKVTALPTGLTDGVNLGSPSFGTLNLPKIAMMVGDGVSVGDAGEIWHTLDYRFEIPVTKLDTRNFSSVDLSKYTHLIIPNAYGSALGNTTEKIKEFVKSGGHVITFRNTINWLNNAELLKVELRKQDDRKAEQVTFEDRSNYYGAQRIGGAIFEVALDRSHPVNFGYSQNKMAVFRNTTQFLEPDKDSFNNPLQYTSNPLLSGYISEENLALLKESAAFKVNRFGSGKVIYFTDNPNFRAFWLNTTKLMMNALFFGNEM